MSVSSNHLSTLLIQFKTSLSVLWAMCYAKYTTPDQLGRKQLYHYIRAYCPNIYTVTTGLLIKVQDIEDKPPEFVSVPSVTRIAEDVPTFTEVGDL